MKKVSQAFEPCHLRGPRRCSKTPLWRAHAVFAHEGGNTLAAGDAGTPGEGRALPKAGMECEPVGFG